MPGTSVRPVGSAAGRLGPASCRVVIGDRDHIESGCLGLVRRVPPACPCHQTRWSGYAGRSAHGERTDCRALGHGGRGQPSTQPAPMLCLPADLPAESPGRIRTLSGPRPFPNPSLPLGRPGGRRPLSARAQARALPGDGPSSRRHFRAGTVARSSSPAHTLAALTSVPGLLFGPSRFALSSSSAPAAPHTARPLSLEPLGHSGVRLLNCRQARQIPARYQIKRGLG